MLIRVLAIWFACGAALFAILSSDPVAVTASPAQVSTEPQAALAHLRCVAPVIEGRSLRTLMITTSSTTTKDYVMAPVRPELQAVGACGSIVLAASR